MRLLGRRYVSDPYRARVQLRWKGHAYQWYYRRATRGIRLFWPNLLPSKLGSSIGIARIVLIARPC